MNGRFREADIGHQCRFVVFAAPHCRTTRPNLRGRCPAKGSFLGKSDWWEARNGETLKLTNLVRKAQSADPALLTLPRHLVLLEVEAAGHILSVLGRQPDDARRCLLNRAVSGMAVEVGRGIAGSAAFTVIPQAASSFANATVTAFSAVFELL